MTMLVSWLITSYKGIKMKLSYCLLISLSKKKTLLKRKWRLFLSTVLRILRNLLLTAMLMLNMLFAVVLTATSVVKIFLKTLVFNPSLLIKCNKPTFITKHGREVIDISVWNSSCTNPIKDWKMSDKVAMSDHWLIVFSFTGHASVIPEGRSTKNRNHVSIMMIWRAHQKHSW